MKNTTKIKVPAKYENRISEIYHDSDGYWVYLNCGWYWDDPGLHTIHEDSQQDVLRCIRATAPCDCDCCKGLED